MPRGKPSPPKNPQREKLVLERMQRDMEGYVDKYNEILAKRAAKYAKEISPVWKRASHNIAQEIRLLMAELIDAQGIPIRKEPIDPAKLRNMQRAIEHLTRLMPQTLGYLKEAEHPEKMRNNLAYAYTESYYFHAWGLEQATKLTVAAPILTHSQVMGVIANPWLADGNTYSDRLRANTAYLGQKMRQSVEEAITQGWDWNRTARRVHEITGEGFYNSVRLARTELNRAASQGSSHLFMQNADILDGKRWNATLDSRTAPKDARNDGKIYELDYDTPESPGHSGERIPNHPHCRCKYSPVVSGVSPKVRERIARGDEDRPDKFGERIYTKAGTYQEYAKERGLPGLDERLANDDPKHYLRRGEDMGADKLPGGKIVPLPGSQNVKAPKASTANNAEQNFMKLLTGIDVKDTESLDRKKVAQALMANSGLTIPVSVRNDIGDANGFCRFGPNRSKLEITEYVLLADDPRPARYRVKTLFHEFYRANAKGLDRTMLDPSDTNNWKDWLDWEETVTETSAHLMARLAGAKGEIAAAYSDKLVRNLPKLKQLDEFKDCSTIEDFGRQFLKYRFTETEKTMDWRKFSGQFSRTEYINNWAEYVETHYKKYATEHRDELVDICVENSPEAPRYAIEQSFKNGWEKLNDSGGPAFSQTLIIIMNRLGVK